jgi:hypothetical protein
MSRLPHRTGTPARTDATVIVRYTDRFPGFYVARILPLAVLFALFLLLYLDADARSWFFSRGSNHDKPFSWLEFSALAALVVAPLLDLALTLRRVRRGAMALALSPAGIVGPVHHTTRLLPWSEIADVTVDGKFLVVRRQPRSLLQTLFASRGLGNINVPAHHLDHGVAEILEAVRHLAPAAYRHAGSH